MTRSARLLFAAALAALCFACAPPPPAIVGPPVRTALCNVNDANSFVRGVSILDTSTGYNPNGAYGVPPRVVGASLTGNVAADLAAAFSVAPGFFRQHLCDLDGIYIDPTPCSGLDGCSTHSWGFRDPASGRLYIGLSQNALWANGNPAPVLTDYETELLNWQLASLNQQSGLTWGSVGPPYFSSRYDPNDPANTSAMTALAALAHELGHVRWYELNVSMPGKYNYDFSRTLMPCRDGSTYFFDQSWLYGISQYYLWPPQWRYATDVPGPGVSHMDFPQISDLQRPGSAAGWRYNVAALLNGRSHPWVSLTASLTPDHDFIETYVFTVLTDNGTVNPPVQPYVQSLLLTVPGFGFSPDIPYDYWHKRGDQRLARKIGCVADLNAAVPLRRPYIP
jgi:hypothetical protein